MDSGVDNTSNPETKRINIKKHPLTGEEKIKCSEASRVYGYCAKEAKKIANEKEAEKAKKVCADTMKEACTSSTKGGRSRPRTRRPRTRRTKRAPRRKR